MAEHRNHPKRRTLTAYALLAVLVIVCAFTHSAIARQLNNWKLLPQPERLTELYFTDPSSLPSDYTPNGNQTVTFTTHNLEYRTTTYNYVVTAGGMDTSQIQELASGTFTLPQNGVRKLTVPITLPALSQREEVSVNLTNVSTSIDFWLNETEAKT